MDLSNIDVSIMHKDKDNVFSLSFPLAQLDILIPSCKTPKELSPLCSEIFRTTGIVNLILSLNPKFSASKNRNLCLAASKAPYVIMMDDDITGLYTGWDKRLVRVLKDDPSVSIVSARLLRPDRSLGAMMASKYDISMPFEEVPKTPTACVAFRNTDIRFDENFKGSGFEDDVFCLQMGPRIVINNEVKVIHNNEMKHQAENWDYNKNRFESTYKK